MMAGLFLLMVGFYILPFGTDVFLYFFVEKVAHGDWVMGAIYANAAALAMILAGTFILKGGVYDE